MRSSGIFRAEELGRFCYNDGAMDQSGQNDQHRPEPFSSRLRLTAAQNRMIAAGLTVLAFAVVLAFIVFVGYVTMRFLSFASSAVTPVIVALFLSMLFKPYYEWFRRRVHNPTLAVVIVFASVLVPLGLLAWFGGSLVAEQVMNLVHSAPTVVQRTSEWVQAHHPGIQSTLLQLGATPDQLTFFSDPAKFTHELLSALGSAYGVDAVRYGFGFVKYMVGLLSWLLVLVFLVYFLVTPQLTGADYVKQLPFLKPDTRSFVAEQIDTFVDIVVSFFRRQVVICLIEGVLYGFGFLLVGLPYGFVIGFLLGLLNLIPFFGSITCLAVALPLAYFGDGGSGLRLVGVLAVWLCGQVLDGYVITPRIQGKKTGLGYAGVIFSFLFWGVVFRSFLGLLLAIPLSAFCVVFWRALKARYIKGVI